MSVKKSRPQYIKPVRKYSNKLHKWYYYEKGTGKRVSRHVWENFKADEKQEKESSYKTTEYIDAFKKNDETLSVFTQSVSGIVKDLVYFHDRIIYAVLEGKTYRIDKKNAHIFFIKLSAYLSKQFKNIDKKSGTPDLFSFIVHKHGKTYIYIGADELENDEFNIDEFL